MEILFVSTSCSKRKYKEVFNMRNRKLIDPQQKFCNLLIEGMSMCEGVCLTSISALPVSASTVSQRFFKEEEEVISSNLTYKYLPFINGKIMRYLTLFVNAYKAAKLWVQANDGKEKVIVCDVLSYYVTRPIQIVAKKYRIKVVGIVTDLPLLATNMKKRKESIVKRIGLSVFQHLINNSIRNYDAYIPLTKSIDEVVNPDRKPSLIIEGSVDYSEQTNMKIVEKKKVVLYAGGIYEKYGLKNLVEAFMKSETHDYELHIYGEGSYVEKLSAIEKMCPKIKYMGMATLDEIVHHEREAMLLINPRPSDEEFSKYSFPSKTLEYMASGTPLLTTRLPGIPEEYFQYTFTFQDESVNGMAGTICNICHMSQDELARKGIEAYNFVLAEKSNIIQGKRIVDFAEYLHFVNKKNDK